MIQLSKPIVIAIDGYSSCGKSSFAKTIANELQYLYIDSGAMYRAVTLFALKHKFIDHGFIDISNLERSLSHIKIDFRHNDNQSKYETWLNDENVEDKIRSMEVSDYVSEISKFKSVRTCLVQIQQKLGAQKGIVMDGRDIGTVVFPNAEIKLFMTATLSVRAQRRFKELIDKGIVLKLEDITTNLAQRDFLDEHRDESPLRKADDAIVLDNTDFTPDQQMKWFKKILYNFQ
jgi:cytidylate kinase